MPGFGAISVSRVKEMLPDAFLKAVVHDGTRITHVKHFGRHRDKEHGRVIQRADGRWVRVANVAPMRKPP